MAVRPFSSLSAGERARLPDSTQVVVGKRTATLGVLRAEHVDYIYPAEHTTQFNPGTGPPFTYKAACDPNYWKLTIDPHGAIVAKAGPKPLSAWNWSTGTSPVSCVVSAYIQS
jgi:hypothetical protein